MVNKNKYNLASLLLGLLFIFAPGGCSDDGEDDTVPAVMTRSGYVSGIMDKGIYTYLGIPFATPPVGERRWRVPVQEDSWTGVRASDRLCEACPQDVSPGNLYGLTSCDEDCLYLNVWTPTVQKGEDLPVMVWFHGGGYNGGSASEFLYNGVNLAKKGVVLVTANYRLGALGFMVSQDLYDDQAQPGNYGLYDAIAALKWVREGIENFGGDPNNVTIFGESSGACSVTLLQQAQQAEGLFHKAIAMSGTASSNRYVLDLTGSWEEAAQNGLALQDYLGATSMAEMRDIPFETIIEASAQLGTVFGPVMDGVILSNDPRQTPFKIQQAPMIVGTVQDEGSLSVYEYNINTVSDYEQALQVWFGENAETVQRYYPASTDEEAMAMSATVFDLAAMQEPTRHTARGASLSVPVWRYYYTHTPPTEGGQYLGCFHGSELAYVFGNLDPAEGYGASDTLFSNQIMALWTNYARTGIPSATDLPKWSPFEVGEENVLHLNGPNDFELSTGLGFDEQCNLFEAIAPMVTPDYPQ